jgi:hypothetical protein
MSLLGSLWRRLLTGNPPAMPHRWRCKGCEATWDTAGSARIPKGTFYIYVYPPMTDGRGLRHHREEVVEDGGLCLSRKIDCGAVVYAGQMVHPLDPRARALERGDEGDDKEFVVPRPDAFKRGETYRVPLETLYDEGAFENHLRQLVEDLDKALSPMPSEDTTFAELCRLWNAANAIRRACRAHFKKGRR